MERSDSLIKFVSVLVFLALAVYIGVSFFRSYTNSLYTTDAIGMEIRDSIDTAGFIVRDEEIITANGGNIAITASEGAKLASGQVLAIQYVGSTAMQRAEQISDLQLRIRQLTAIKNGKSGEELAAESIRALSRALASGDLTDLYSVELDVDAYVIEGSALATGNEEAEIERLQEQLRLLIEQSASDTVRITSPASGTFSYGADGYEGVSPADLENLTLGKYHELFAAPRSLSAGAIGKLIRGTRWYYVTEMDEAAAMKLNIGGRADLNFTRSYSASLSMKVESVSLAENGQCAVVFSCDSFLQDVAGIREATAELVFGSLSGISVPREAVHLDEDGQTFVYILEGLMAHVVDVNILAENGDYYMVEATKTGLRVNDIIIVRADNLYNGAVVER